MTAGPNYRQIIRQVFIAAKDALRVCVVNDSNNPIPVDPTTRGTPKILYNEINSTGVSTTQILSLTVGVGLGVDLRTLELSGGNRAIYTIKINSDTKFKKRAYFADYNLMIDLREIPLIESDIIEIEVENKTNMATSFNGTLIYNEYTA